MEMKNSLVTDTNATIVRVERMKKMANGARVDSESIRIVFDGDTLPGRSWRLTLQAL